MHFTFVCMCGWPFEDPESIFSHYTHMENTNKIPIKAGLTSHTHVIEAYCAFVQPFYRYARLQYNIKSALNTTNMEQICHHEQHLIVIWDDHFCFRTESLYQWVWRRPAVYVHGCKKNLTRDAQFTYPRLQGSWQTCDYFSVISLLASLW